MMEDLLSATITCLLNNRLQSCKEQDIQRYKQTRNEWDRKHNVIFPSWTCLKTKTSYKIIIVYFTKPVNLNPLGIKMTQRQTI